MEKADMKKPNEEVEKESGNNPEEEIVDSDVTVAEEELEYEPDTEPSQSSEPSEKTPDELIREARELVEKSDHEVKDCMEILDEDIDAYEGMRSKVVDGSLHTTESLLEEVGFEPETIEDSGEEGVKFTMEEAVEPMQVRDLSSGKFGAFILALIFGIAVVAGWIYVATEKLGMTLDITKVPAKDVQEKILSWIGGGITGGEGNPVIGMVILAVSALVVMWIVYKIRVYIREVHNQKVAEEINENAKFYCTKKEECKKEMEKISEHIHRAIASLKTYDIFFEELNAKIKRILHLEGKVPFREYHPKSKEEIKHATILINSFKELVSTPMAGENGSLSEEGKRALERSNRTLELHREKLYQ